MGWVFKQENHGYGDRSSSWRGEGHKTYGRTNRRNSGENRKKSGCRTSIIGKGKYKGKICFHGWNKSKAAGYVKFFAAPYKKTRLYVSKNKVEWVTYILKLSRHMMPDQVLPCLYNKTNGKLVCQKLGIVMNPKAPNGGYIGTFLTRK